MSFLVTTWKESSTCTAMKEPMSRRTKRRVYDDDNNDGARLPGKARPGIRQCSEF